MLKTFHPFEIAGEAFIGETESSLRRCIAVVTASPSGAEIWLYVDAETNELVKAQRIDGEWTELDTEDAAEEYADVLYCI